MGNIQEEVSDEGARRERDLYFAILQNGGHALGVNTDPADQEKWDQEEKVFRAHSQGVEYIGDLATGEALGL